MLHMACHDCDLVYQIDTIPYGAGALCSRCGATLYKPKRDSLNRTLALTLAGVTLFLIANTFPFLGFKVGAQVRDTTLVTGIYQLFQQDMWIIATLVFFTVIMAPAVHLLGMLYILVPLLFNRTPLHLAAVFRFILLFKPWGMLEIFMLGILVSIVKLAKMATIIPGVAVYAFMALIFAMAAMANTLDDHQIWERIEVRK
jgi:paraquat-inducible protein A